MNKKIIIAFALLDFSVSASAEIDQSMLNRLNSDFDRVSKFRQDANPGKKDLDTIIAQKNAALLS